MRVLGVTTAILLGLSATATAGPLDLKQVSAEAKWIVHFDVDAMRESTLVQRVYDKCVDQWPAAEQRLREATDLVEHLGLDLTRDLHGLTAYGTKVGDLDGVFPFLRKFYLPSRKEVAGGVDHMIDLTLLKHRARFAQQRVTSAPIKVISAALALLTNLA